MTTQIRPTSATRWFADGQLGADYDPTGRVTVTWRNTDGTDETLLDVTWAPPQLALYEALRLLAEVLDDQEEDFEAPEDAKVYGH